ncbi:glycine zipper family protein [Aliarcobacter cryaerophilus]|uniref:glycine zipper family protein n=1 Tax=Aliarcobacter cryaerophilus TaxID=28198 RepID=UPI0008347C9B|nr:glycine zipper family protein [Aliarcobacter cryaerophilus]
MKKLTFLLLFLTSNLFAFTQTNFDIALKDFENNNMAKYRDDELILMSSEALLKNGIISNGNDLIRDVATNPNIGISLDAIRQSLKCSFVTDKYTATVYAIKPKEGIVTCMVALKDDIYNPIGLFNVFYPTMKKAYALDLEKAEKENISVLNGLDAQFKPLSDRIKAISNSINVNNHQEFLTVPELLTAAVLTDTDVVDFEKTDATGTFQLKDNFTSVYQDVNSGEYIDNKKYILADAETFSKVYTGLGDISMSYYVLIILLFGVSGISRKALGNVFAKMEKRQKPDGLIPYTLMAVVGVLLFIPTTYTQTQGNTQYEVYKTKYQEFEKDGYALFNNWADDAAKVIIDSEVSSLLKKSGVGTRDQGVSTIAGYEQYKKLKTFNQDFWSICVNDIYNYSGLLDSNNKHHYSQDPNQPFPLNEKWAYIMSKIKNNASVIYYSPSPKGEVKSASSYSTSTNNEYKDVYPDFSLSSCGKNYYDYSHNNRLFEDYSKQRDILINQDNSGKLVAIESLLTNQYELYRDFGFLSVLGLPVLKLQTEYIGGLYKTQRSEVLDKLNKQIAQTGDGDGGDDEFLHSFFSSIPYLFVPGAGTVFQVITENSGKIGAVFGSKGGPIGTIIGATIGTISGGALGMKLAYEVASNLLQLTPILGLIVIGLLRYVIILIKIFVFHFISLFLMPLMFVQQNLEAFFKFTMKIFITMVEIPIFVLSIWLALSANSLLHTIGDIFGKKMIIFMLENNNNLTKDDLYDFGALKIYLFDGFLEIIIAVFSTIIIYKIIITLHETVSDILEVQGTNRFDSAIESMKSDATGWGQKI